MGELIFSLFFGGVVIFIGVFSYIKIKKMESEAGQTINTKEGSE